VRSPQHTLSVHTVYFDLLHIERDREVGNGCVFFGYVNKNGVGDMFADAMGELGWVGHKQIVTNELHPFT
jgi:hypothetical protein